MTSSDKGLPKTSPTSEEGLDSMDPHPAQEGDPYAAKHPGGASPPKVDIGPNPARHDGNPPLRPDNVATKP